MRLASSAIFLSFISAIACADTLKPFTTDGCSIFPDGSLEDNAKWMECCIRHDFAYWQGGSLLEREEADDELKSCVANLGEKNISLLMHLGVRMGGSPLYPTWYRWGYGWSYMRGYEPLSKEEQAQIKGQLLVLHNLIGEFLDQAASKASVE
ncbi:hypothetical protein SAMN02745866_01804 [Alteromonadaceae bacterium Bs31]|nr:hypothetical protein SAMN02745866_01804 [Alteromonadaceae bacterium Bs31]